MKYMFGTKINGTDESGICDFTTNPPTLICLCSEENSKLILSAFKTQEKYYSLQSETVSQTSLCLCAVSREIQQINNRPICTICNKPVF